MSGIKTRNSTNKRTKRGFKTGIATKTKPFLSLLLLFFLASFANLTHAGPPRPARPPLLSGQPFIVFWGIKDSSCANRPDFRSFGIEPEGRVAVFYEDTLGNYPYFVDKDNAVNGGLPQHTKLDLHIRKTQGDVETALPAPRYLGLGVVRWQEWAPQWSRRGGKQGLYQNATKKQLRRFFPDWTKQELERWSKVDFEAAAQSVITETLREVQRSRPKALWGMCPYPSCSNGSPAQTALSNYTGECPEEERSLNDQLLWLWRRSNAIYPLLTLEKIQGETRGAALFLSNLIREALRVASLGGSSEDLPVFPLVRSVYTSTNTFLSLSDLVTTIGESAALGTAGIVIWDKTEPKTERECEDLSLFTSSVLGPYVSNVTAASRLCSASLCQNRGRCVRLEQDQPTYLHLPSNSPDSADRVKRSAHKLTSDEATDQPDPSLRPDPDPAELWKRDFQCQWFSSSDRDVSDQQTPKDGAPSVGKREDSVGQGLDVLPTVSDGIATTTGAYGAQNGDNGGSKSRADMQIDLSLRFKLV
ncbi:glyco_hydro_56 domain-containing protein [Boleophthalmus pectinirostris]|uniref:glyco_hydro_56 domain-containing protein n=1 Tax=Boleophthalmus pectinirostris TaxID=150288 RepID=UPI002431CE03|nr:glyco_hydro_56 domain-containing protein [Boleophthalmus pectinirostris]